MATGRANRAILFVDDKGVQNYLASIFVRNGVPSVAYMFRAERRHPNGFCVENPMQKNTAHYGIFGLIPLAALLFVLSTGNADILEDIEWQKHAPQYSLEPARMIQAFQDVQDTLYTTDSVYMVVDLQDQDVMLHFRSGRTERFLVSSGNPWIRDGMATPTGIFTVQNKVPMAISRQFNDARLHNWIGVNGGVGFHGLDGSGYYWNLGKRASSHGCIRMSREEIREMYDMIHVGVPILIRDGEPARVIAFCEPWETQDAFVIDSATARIRGIGKDRINALYAGRYFEEPTQRLVHIAGTRVSWHIDAGLKSRVPRQHVSEQVALPSITEVVTGEG